MTEKCKVVALCGVDGVGKSTIVRELEQLECYPGTRFHKKDNSYISELVEEYHSRENEELEWNEGSFAQAVAVGAAFDWLSYYKRVIEPSLVLSNLHICDRYFPCYSAYFSCVSVAIDPIRFFGNVRQPDLIIFVDASDSFLPKRYAERGGQTEDENLPLMRMMRQQYPKTFQRHNIRVRKVTNEGPFSDTMSEVMRLISEVIGE